MFVRPGDCGFHGLHGISQTLLLRRERPSDLRDSVERWSEVTLVICESHFTDEAASRSFFNQPKSKAFQRPVTYILQKPGPGFFPRARSISNEPYHLRISPLAAQCSRSSSVCPRSLKRSVVMVGMVKADPAGPKLIMNDAIKRIGLLHSRLTSVRETRAAGEIKKLCGLRKQAGDLSGEIALIVPPAPVEILLPAQFPSSLSDSGRCPDTQGSCRFGRPPEKRSIGRAPAVKAGGESRQTFCMAAVIGHHILQTAGRVGLIFRVFAQLDQQAANFRDMMALQGGERENVVALIAIRQRPTRAEICLELFISPGECLQITVLSCPAVGRGF